MKFTITFKDPDGVDECLTDAINADIDRDTEGLSDMEKQAIFDIRYEAMKKKLAKFIRYGEYLVVDFDLDAGTATVKEQP